jgi:hypothetical protein
MAAGIQEHVRQGIPDFPRRSQRARVKALGEHGATATERPVQRARDPGANGHHAPTERLRVRCFDE